ncbi:histone deacetylase family protein [Ancylostoma ceylanicum]|uniref:histone deacetylase n=1 Tax=Ancylostoma ceylanicum TaxID=53326 RepID=A0A0D6M341_9BILA|nr:histone deacetylase family protein [Ancylostoma ceylanicum]
MTSEYTLNRFFKENERSYDVLDGSDSVAAFELNWEVKNAPFILDVDMNLRTNQPRVKHVKRKADKTHRSTSEKSAVEVFKQKQMDLMAHFERAQQALNMQHLQQYYQTLQQHAQQQAANSAAQAGPERMDEGLCDAAVAPLALASSMGSLLGSSQSPTTSREAPAPQRARSEHRNASTNSTSQTISQHTKDRLKNMIAQRNREGSQTNLAGTPPQQHAPMSPQVNVSSPHFEPYRVPASLHTAQAVSSQPSAEYQLRKVNSEPNLKMRIRAKLLSKGSSPVQNQSTFNFTHPQLKRSDSETSGNGAAAGNLAMDALLTNAAATAFPPHLIMPSPSLPNLAAPNLAQAPQLPIDLASLMAAAQLTPFLSLPSLFKTQIGLGGGLLEEDVADRAKLAPGVAALGTLSQQLPVFGNPSLLKQQLRELVLRRKSLVREEPEDDDSLCAQPVLSPGQMPTSLGLGDMSGGKATGLAYDSSMARHECVCGESSSHVEHGGRVQSIWARLLERGLVQKCERIAAKKASLEQLRMVHSPTYVTFFAVSPTACLKMEASQLPLKSFVQLPCGGIGIDSDTYFNDATTQTAARVAAGSLIELASQVAENRLRNGFACIRPPGHHSEKDQAMGFCFFNNVAITARYLQNKYPQQCARIAIIDWDVHHGNGTQLCFEEDPSVLYLSLHRHDNGNFFPGTGAVTEVGRGAGKGFSVNVPFSGGVMRDADYLAAWRVLCGDDDKAGVLKNEALEGIPCLSAQETIQKVIAIHKGYWPTLTAEQGLSISELHWQTVGRQFQNLTMGTVS